MLVANVGWPSVPQCLCQANRATAGLGQSLPSDLPPSNYGKSSGHDLAASAGRCVAQSEVLRPAVRI